MTVTVDDGVLFCAFRYALGRMTYVVDDVATAIERNADKIEPKLCDLMCKEINDALSRGQAGHDIDIARWRDVHDTLQKSLYERKNRREKTT